MRSFLLASTVILVPALTRAAQCALPPDPRLATAAPAAAALPAQPSPYPPVAPERIAATPALRRLALHGAELLDLGRDHGVQAVFARNSDAFQVFFITPDGEAAIGGVMWSAAGENLTRKALQPIEGAIPTVVINGPAKAGAPPPVARPVATQETPQAAPKPVQEAVAATTFGTLGRASAPRLWMFVDPLCSFSVRAMEQLNPFVASGRVQLAIIPISILDYEDRGQSTAAAKAMLSLKPGEMVDAWRDHKLTEPADPHADDRLSANMAAAEAAGLRGTPLLLWQRPDGTQGTSNGLPADLGRLIASLGS